MITAVTGNPYGVSRAAPPSYSETVKSLSPNEIRLMLDLTRGTSLLAGRSKTSKNFERRYRALVALLDPKSVPTSAKSLYNKWLPTE